MSGMAAALLGAVPAFARRDTRLGERAVTVTATPLRGFLVGSPDERRFGALTFLGGLELRSDDPEFGGISSAVIDPDGMQFIAISDHAHWITGRLLEQDGRLSGITETRIAPMLSSAGRRLKDTRWFDSEGLARSGKRLFVSVERVHDILRYELVDGRPSGRPTMLPVPPDMKSLGSNQGIEALGVMPERSAMAGALIAIAERPPKAALEQEVSPAWLIGGRMPGRLGIRRRDGFDITDLAFLPDGDMLLLERRFRPLTGVACRIRRIALETIKPGAVLDGSVLISADMRHQIDNMEAMTIHRHSDGRIILTLMSDDNFSLLQRTLVLRFALEAREG